ncbi:MAG TPA: hypothetical protein ENI51_09780, partial [Candidatus Atribacteria bacterium]|nr:hypothetical protein [Candidatus Atribacteria bacterium]
MTKIGGIIKIFSLVVAAFMVITSFGPVIETYIAKEALSLEDFEDPSITQEKKEELEKAGSELIRELKNYTRDFESFLNNALDKTSSQKDIEEAINDFKKDVIDKYLTEEDVKEEISGEILDNNSLSGEILDNNSSIQLFFEELRNHHDLYISEIEIAVNESYQKELSLKLASLEKIEEKTNKTVRVKEDKEENKDYQINEIKKSEEKTTSVAYSSATKKFLSSINKLIPTNSRLKELISKMFNISEDILLNPLDNRKEQSNNQKEFIDVNEEKKVMRYDDKIDSTLFNESSTSTLPNDFYDVDYS